MTPDTQKKRRGLETPDDCLRWLEERRLEAAMRVAEAAPEESEKHRHKTHEVFVRGLKAGWVAVPSPLCDWSVLDEKSLFLWVRLLAVSLTARQVGGVCTVRAADLLPKRSGGGAYELMRKRFFALATRTVIFTDMGKSVSLRLLDDAAYDAPSKTYRYRIPAEWGRFFDRNYFFLMEVSRYEKIKGAMARGIYRLLLRNRAAVVSLSLDILRQRLTYRGRQDHFLTALQGAAAALVEAALLAAAEVTTSSRQVMQMVFYKPQAPAPVVAEEPAPVVLRYFLDFDSLIQASTSKKDHSDFDRPPVLGTAGLGKVSSSLMSFDTEFS